MCMEAPQIQTWLDDVPCNDEQVLREICANQIQHKTVSKHGRFSMTFICVGHGWRGDFTYTMRICGLIHFI